MIETILHNIQGIITFAVFLGILISVHEWGHFITAKKCGVTVEEFAIGFGPTIFSKFHNGTKYMLKIFPLGGYVKMAGDERDKCTGQSGEFFSQPVGKRALIVLNGPMINFLLAYLCLVTVFMTGFPDLSTKVGKLIDDYPAKEAGLLVDDTIVAINQQKVDSWSSVQKIITQTSAAKLEFTVDRGGKEVFLSIVPKIKETKNIFGRMEQKRLVGIVPAEEFIILKYGFLKAVANGGEMFMKVTTDTGMAVFSMITGSMSVKDNVTGPIGIYNIVVSFSEKGFSHFLLILGIISLNLAIFNLFPILPLDGGHLFLFGIEKLRGRALSPKVDNFIANFGFSLIILLAVFVFYADFERIGLIEKIKNIFL